MSSRLARAALALWYRPGRAYRVPFGPLRGARLHYDRAMTYRAMLGLHDAAILGVVRDLLAARSRRRDRGPLTVCDVGANVGYYSLGLSRWVGPEGRVVAFEPCATARALLRTNLALNGCANVEVIAAACCDREGPVTFFEGIRHDQSSLDAGWALGQGGTAAGQVVPGLSLDGFFASRPGPGPDFIKVDIEGGGVLALPGAARCAREARPTWLIESHTPAEDRAIGELAFRQRYAAFRLADHCWVRDLDQTYPDPHGVWGTLLLCPVECRDDCARLLDGR